MCIRATTDSVRRSDADYIVAGDCGPPAGATWWPTFEVPLPVAGRSWLMALVCMHHHRLRHFQSAYTFCFARSEFAHLIASTPPEFLNKRLHPRPEKVPLSSVYPWFTICTWPMLPDAHAVMVVPAILLLSAQGLSIKKMLDRATSS